jgi:hypothetical protein
VGVVIALELPSLTFLRAAPKETAEQPSARRGDDEIDFGGGDSCLLEAAGCGGEGQLDCMPPIECHRIGQTPVLPDELERQHAAPLADARAFEKHVESPDAFFSEAQGAGDRSGGLPLLERVSRNCGTDARDERHELGRSIQAGLVPMS